MAAGVTVLASVALVNKELLLGAVALAFFCSRIECELIIACDTRFSVVRKAASHAKGAAINLAIFPSSPKIFRERVAYDTTCSEYSA